MLKHVLNPPNWFTAASIFCSVYAMSLVAGPGVADSSTLARACVLVIFGGIFDLLDGRVARLTNTHSEFGVQLDSFADMLGFGLAPAVIAWAWLLHDLGPVGVLVAFVFVVSAAFRLARFNVDETPWPLHGHTQGLTTTMAGGTLVTFIWVANGYLAERLDPATWPDHLLAFLVSGLMVALGGLMVSSLPFRNFKDLRRNKRARALLAVSLACCLTGAVVLDPSMWWGVGGAMYLTVGVVDGLVTAIWMHNGMEEVHVARWF